eukprot:CAMPEP_0115835608 /NCGR_PEP_ID=MMETSP0287-20121206/4282_1 /TAXON_ID=412157 /ORGANISM="Chrysochromulina rotalis, Strain UIO044" /LENGTH=397 /DNA_ID=CAMNT_0003289071 /DNA_START=54 /DNA_END=1247 /DNA_ORIENTATION=-
MRKSNTSSFGANPGNPYITYDLMPEQHVHNGVPTFPMGLSDAVLLITCTPSAARYFSWRSYLFDIANELGDTLLFASMGDTSNDLVVRTIGSDGIAGDARMALVTTGDATTYADISSALLGAGLGNATNLDQIELSLFDGRQAQYTMLHRASVWQDPIEREQYFAHESDIFYVRAPNGRSPHALALSHMRVRGTGEPESAIVGLSDAFEALHEHVIVHMASLGLSLEDTSRCPNKNLTGRDCIESDANCKGDNPDANYLVCAQRVHPLGNDDFYVLLVSNCAATGKCTYHNAGVYYDLLTSTSITTDNTMWDGSAQAFAPALDPQLSSKLAAIVFARDCTPLATSMGAYCVPISYKDVPRGHTWYTIVRTYLEPTTATGPLASELLAPKLLHFSGRL